MKNFRFKESSSVLLFFFFFSLGFLKKFIYFILLFASEKSGSQSSKKRRIDSLFNRFLLRRRARLWIVGHRPHPPGARSPLKSESTFYSTNVVFTQPAGVVWIDGVCFKPSNQFISNQTVRTDSSGSSHKPPHVGRWADGPLWLNPKRKLVQQSPPAAASNTRIFIKFLWTQTPPGSVIQTTSAKLMRGRIFKKPPA